MPCTQDSGIMALFAILISIFAGLAAWLPLFSATYSVSGVSIDMTFHMMKTCLSVPILGEQCQSYPDNVFCKGQDGINRTNSAMSGLTIIVALVALCAGCCAAKITHSILFSLCALMSFICMGLTISLSQFNGCDEPAEILIVAAIKAAGVSLGAGFFMIVVAAIVSMVGIGFACRNKTVCCESPEPQQSTTTIIVAGGGGGFQNHQNLGVPMMTMPMNNNNGQQYQQFVPGQQIQYGQQQQQQQYGQQHQMFAPQPQQGQFSPTNKQEQQQQQQQPSSDNMMANLLATDNNNSVNQ